MEISTQKLSDGIVLTLRSPSDSTKSPVIILCHGFCGIREILLPDFAEAFTRAGFSTITFDYRGFGCQQRVKSDPLTATTNGLILIHLVYSGLASAITP
ncbi:alpha/beta hydrolase family protein, partial [Klebsiella pneumoniae]